MAEKREPLRQCVGCREMKPKREMMRVIRKVSADGEKAAVSLDITGKQDGRGAYICPSPECLGAAIKNRGLERSFHMKVPGDVYDALAKEMMGIET